MLVFLPSTSLFHDLFHHTSRPEPASWPVVPLLWLHEWRRLAFLRRLSPRLAFHDRWVAKGLVSTVTRRRCGNRLLLDVRPRQATSFDRLQSHRHFLVLFLDLVLCFAPINCIRTIRGTALTFAAHDNCLVCSVPFIKRKPGTAHGVHPVEEFQVVALHAIYFLLVESCVGSIGRLSSVVCR